MTLRTRRAFKIMKPGPLIFESALKPNILWIAIYDLLENDSSSFLEYLKGVTNICQGCNVNK